MKKNNIKKYFENSKDYINRWVVSYADFTTVLLALFVFLFALSNNDNIKIKDFKESIKKEFKQEKFLSKNTLPKNENEINVINEAEKNDSLFELVKNNLGKDSKIEVIENEKGITLRLKDTLLFDSASAEIKNSSLKTVSDIANFLTTIDNPVIIEGHTDSIPIKNSVYATNWELSSARAINL
ncbi:MAG: OmpA family protein, partial [Candidatus Gastranaerophilales bacterium]|nr:OmpA family protein [Candidatus Gastranaerophilales bacterium]